jgi:hypothetical protein
MKTTWRKLIAKEMVAGGDPGPVLRCTLTEAGLDAEFDSGYGSPEGKPFTAWTAARVYFPVCYDGAESVASVPRAPCDETTSHVGGW